MNDIDIKILNKYLNCIDIIYWINLDKSIVRKNNMENILKYINTRNHRISAIDGKKSTDDDIYSRLIGITKFRTKTEYACLLSHLDTIRIFANSNYENALIFEDDITLEYVKFWNKSFCKIISDAPHDWDIIMLNYVSSQSLKEIYTLNINGKISCCQAYIINKRSAQYLMNQIYIGNNKYMLNKNFIHTADDYIYSSLITYVYKYPYFTYSIENDSTIHPSHLNYHNNSKIIALLSWKDFYNFDLNNKYKMILYNIKLFNKIKYIIIIIILILLFMFYKSKK
jgi:GR25 family glycosyltransferase involved in LPS biosynthesis